jgi:hypothetical protein
LAKRRRREKDFGLPAANDFAPSGLERDLKILTFFHFEILPLPLLF